MDALRLRLSGCFVSIMYGCGEGRDVGSVPCFYLLMNPIKAGTKAEAACHKTSPADRPNGRCASSIV